VWLISVIQHIALLPHSACCLKLPSLLPDVIRCVVGLGEEDLLRVQFFIFLLVVGNGTAFAKLVAHCVTGWHELHVPLRIHIEHDSFLLLERSQWFPEVESGFLALG